MIVVTGAAGFIGSCLVSELNRLGYKDLVLVDDFSNKEKNKNLSGKTFTAQIERNEFFDWFKVNGKMVQLVFHIGARTNTAEFDRDLLWKLNTNYSKSLWKLCIEFGVPFLYASSAATYGLGEKGFDDTISPTELKPLNAYGDSKNEFDEWVLNQQETPVFWAGFKFFNVFGPNEYHKGRMASVVFHAFNQIQEKGKVRLFRSHHSDYADGEQLRDFIYIKDVLAVLLYFMNNRKRSGIYNLGTGKAESFLHLAESVFKALDKAPNIEFIDTPEDIREKYQYYTCANTSSLRLAGCQHEFLALETAIDDYVKSFLLNKNYF
jgi:ADP-L-glycero-D-manno-heptose 6-epimerase